ncbi:hypothetical protein ASG11_04085 [Sphingomonas sp. Leaf357]|uniref:hypothetical protein n=1 Tax=Sphingomonas sp. Leaf357 TaxID=1736350 RepID=UPI0006F866F7|nr:hypothetical protein [Sphingomonas sp. Leaf357]KQS03535.1 hypothetical protein ASG11_04085 [Sphingomonas sp. Leaf357]
MTSDRFGDRLLARGRAIGAARADAVRARVVEVIGQEVPGARFEIEGFEVTVWARGLRLVLRWIGSLLR